MARYLVTGGCGFIGSHLADALVARGDQVRIVDDLSTGRRDNAPPRAEVIVADVGDRAVLDTAMADVDGCFHLAAIASVARSNEDWPGTHRVNLSATVDLLDAARGRSTPVVYASSAAVYGDNPDLPLREEARPQPLTAYGADKLGCELHAMVAARVHGIASTGFRFFNVYGPRQDPSSPYSGVISIFADRIGRGLPVTVHGDGQQERDFVYVADVVRALMAGMERTRSGGAAVLNVCTGRPTTVAALAALLGEAFGRKADIRFGLARSGDIRRSLGSPDRLLAEIGIEASTPLAVGLRRLVVDAGEAE